MVESTKIILPGPLGSFDFVVELLDNLSFYVTLVSMHVVPFTFSTIARCVTDNITPFDCNELKIILMHLGDGVDVTRC